MTWTVVVASCLVLEGHPPHPRWASREDPIGRRIRSPLSNLSFMSRKRTRAKRHIAELRFVGAAAELAHAVAELAHLLMLSFYFGSSSSSAANK